MRPLITPEEAQRRLKMLFGGAFDTSLSSPLAGFAVASMIYVGAVADEDPETWARPTTVLWQRDEVLSSHGGEDDRAAWRDAAARSSERLGSLLESWGITGARRYKENSRESLRDETWRELHQKGAVRKRTGIATSSDKPRWALEPHFADLFDPSLRDDALADAITQWENTYLDASSLLRANVAHRRRNALSTVSVTLPDGTVRSLESGKSSEILKGVIEKWAITKLGDPVVLAISEPGEKVFIGDRHTLESLGLVIDKANLLPDALIADLTDGVTFWIIEAVASDGPITEQRKRMLEQWARGQRIDPQQLRYLTAFLSRNAAPAKRRLKDLAAGTFAWYLDEPMMELQWVPLAEIDG